MANSMASNTCQLMKSASVRQCKKQSSTVVTRFSTVTTRNMQCLQQYRKTNLFTTKKSKIITTSALPETSSSRTDATFDGFEDDMEFCDDFECTSSPALEPTIRTLTADIRQSVDGRRSMRCYIEKCQYKDSMRSFTGRDKYERMMPIAEAMPDCKARITSVNMDGLDTCIIKYKLQGPTPAGKLDMDFTETYLMNTITGRVEEHTVEWSNGRSDTTAAGFFQTTRATYCAKQGLADLNEGFDKLLDETAGQNQQEFQGDPADPLKFFQQEDNKYEDMFVFAAAATLIYAVVQIALM